MLDWVEHNVGGTIILMLKMEGLSSRCWGRRTLHVYCGHWTLSGERRVKGTCVRMDILSVHVGTYLRTADYIHISYMNASVSGRDRAQTPRPHV